MKRLVFKALRLCSTSLIILLLPVFASAIPLSGIVLDSIEIQYGQSWSGFVLSEFSATFDDTVYTGGVVNVADAIVSYDFYYTDVDYFENTDFNFMYFNFSDLSSPSLYDLNFWFSNYYPTSTYSVIIREDALLKVSVEGWGTSDALSITINSHAADTPAPVPEPSTAILLGLGLVGLIGYGKKRKKS